MKDTWTRTFNEHQRKQKKYLVNQKKADEKQRKNHKKHNTPQKTKTMRNTDFTRKKQKIKKQTKMGVNTCPLDG